MGRTVAVGDRGCGLNSRVRAAAVGWTAVVGDRDCGLDSRGQAAAVGWTVAVEPCYFTCLDEWESL